jgi:hypothetical protein
MSLMDLYNSDPVWGPSGLSGYWPLERERTINLYNAVIGFTNVFQLSKFFLLFLHYLLLAHIELLLHTVVGYPELDAES